MNEGTRSRLHDMRCLRSLLCVLALCSAVALGQSPVPAGNPGASQSEVVMTKLFPPVYPPLARAALVEGDVRLSVKVRTDGTVESARIVVGNPLLQYGALQSAQQSTFECRGCTEPVNSYEMVYSFQLVGKCCPTNEDSVNSTHELTPAVGASQSGNQVHVIAQRGCLCGGDISMVRVPKVRSPKCLYLWQCAYSKKAGGWQ
jgi:TonB family protein